jgi:hypothetical protein
MYTTWPIAMPLLTLALLSAVAICLVAAGALRLAGRGSGSGSVPFWSGLAIAAITAWLVWPSLQVPDVRPERDRLRDAASAAEARAGALRGDKEALAAALTAAVARMKQAEREQSALVDRLERDIAGLHARFRSADSPIILETQPRRREGGTDRVGTLMSDLTDLHGLVPRPAPERKAQMRDLLLMRDRMAARWVTPNFDIEAFPARELVGGRSGRYYVVDLKDAASGVRFYFEGGKYTLRATDAEVRRALNAFIAEVLSHMQGAVRYELFVRGSADRKPYEGRPDPTTPMQRVAYLRAAGPDRYLGEQGETVIDTIVRNRDLPNLRAGFLRDLVAATYPVKVPVVLEGAVTDKIDDRDRNVELILFVDW